MTRYWDIPNVICSSCLRPAKECRNVCSETLTKTQKKAIALMEEWLCIQISRGESSGKPDPSSGFKSWWEMALAEASKTDA